MKANNTNPLFEGLFGGLFGGHKKEEKQSMSPQAEFLTMTVAYVMMYLDKDPVLIKEHQKLEKMGLNFVGNYTNVVLCASTVIQWIQKGADIEQILVSSKSAMNLVKWGRVQMKTNRMFIQFMNGGN